MRRASAVVAWLFVLLGARLLVSAPGELARGHALAAMAFTSAGMVLVIGGGLSILARRRHVRRPAAAPRPAPTEEWASPSRGDRAAE